MVRENSGHPTSAGAHHVRIAAPRQDDSTDEGFLSFHKCARSQKFERTQKPGRNHRAAAYIPRIYIHTPRLRIARDERGENWEAEYEGARIPADEYAIDIWTRVWTRVRAAR